MNNFVSKLSLYDILSMVIPGGTIFLFLSLTLGYKLKIDECAIDPVLGWTIALVLSYLLGLINHVCTGVMWGHFRNNPAMIQYALGNKQNKCKILCRWIMGIVVIFAFLLVLSSLCDTNWMQYRWMLPFIVFIIILSFYTCLLISRNIFPKKEDKEILDKYYEQYYYVAKHRYNDDIFIMEGQIAFMQCMIIPLFCLLCISKCDWYCLDDDTLNVVRVLLSLLLCFLIPTIFLRQIKIYQRVEEDCDNLKKIEEYDKTHQ